MSIQYKFHYDKSISLEDGNDGYPASPDREDILGTCAVCKRLGYYEADEQIESIHVHKIYIKHLILHNDYLYLVPIFHPRCREMFELNPLAYE